MPVQKMGSNCNLSQGVIIGGITIDNDVAIVTKSVPNRVVVAGDPAQILSYKGSFEMITYDGMDDDPERKVSLALRED